MIDEITRNNVVNDVRNGMSYFQSAKKYDIGYDSVRRWCHDADVHSSFHASRRKTDGELLKVIAAHRVLTCRELSKFLGCTYPGLNTRLRNMVRNGKIQSFRIPHLSHAAKTRGVLTRYVNTRIYFVSNDDLAMWVRSQFPEDVPKSLRRYVTQLFRSLDVKIFVEAKK